MSVLDDYIRELLEKAEAQTAAKVNEQLKAQFYNNAQGFDSAKPVDNTLTPLGGNVYKTVNDGLGNNVLYGSVSTNKKPTLSEKYEGLGNWEKLQKAASKFPLGNSLDKQYYGQAARFADNEAPSKFMQKQNDFYKLSDIQDEELKNIQMKKIAQMYNMDSSNPEVQEQIKQMNMDVVMPKSDSQLYEKIKKSKEMQEWVAKNYDSIKAGEYNKEKDGITFGGGGWGARRELFNTIHRADLHNPRIDENGSFSVRLNDGYDFDKMNVDENEQYKKVLAWINNNAYNQQQKEKIKNYLLTTSIQYTPEELEEILQKYRNNY